MSDFDKLHGLGPSVRKKAKKMEIAMLEELVQIAKRVGDWEAA